MDLVCTTPYTASRAHTVRRPTREVKVGGVGIGGANPLRVQSMTTTPTQDVAATVAQAIALAEAGSELVRITAQNVKAAEALRDIRDELRRAKVDVPLVADIHFLPSAAMEAVKWVEKVRVNPGNYADKKKFAVLEYSDAEYERELQRLHEAFSPLVLECKRLGRAMRIGTNHGSLSDRIMNRFGDTPEGMVQSALEFVRICESRGYHEIILSMKASNPKVMIAAYRLAAARMAEEGMDYPLHLGVTEAGDGEDGRIKSAIGIGALLQDGLGDTIRVSLTEDPVHELPVARDLARKATTLWTQTGGRETVQEALQGETLDGYAYRRREVVHTRLGEGAACGEMEPPLVILSPESGTEETEALAAEVTQLKKRFRDLPVEGLLLSLPADAAEAVSSLSAVLQKLDGAVPFLVAEVPGGFSLEEARQVPLPRQSGLVWCRRFGAEENAALRDWLAFARESGTRLAPDLLPEALEVHAPALAEVDPASLLLTCTRPTEGAHMAGTVRALMGQCQRHGLKMPLWLRGTPAAEIEPKAEGFTHHLLEASAWMGSLLCDGYGDLVSIETAPLAAQRLTLAYNLLQGARARTSKTEYVACPSCGRTLFDLQTTTARIRERTGHLKGVTIAVMGCIVNGPGEMADADFGYVGGAPGKVNLYVGKTPVQFNIPQAEAVERLVGLIREHGKWTEPEPVEPVEA